MEHAAASTSHSNADTGYTKDNTSEFKTTEIFKSQDNLVEYVREIAISNGFDVVTINSDSGNGKKRGRVILGCERKGKRYKLSENSEPIKCECPFKLKGGKLATKENQWELTVVDGIHKHPLGDVEGGRSSTGRLSQKEKSLCREMAWCLAQPKEILAALKQMNEHNKSSLRTIYNELQRSKVVEKCDMQQFLSRFSKLSEYNYIMQQRSCSGKNAQDFFWTHSTSLDLLRTFPCVLMISAVGVANDDCSLRITGVTSTDMPFFVGDVYLSSEERDNFLWALDTLRGMMNGFAMPDVIVTDADYLALISAIEEVFGTTVLLLSPQIINLRVEEECRILFESNHKLKQFMGKWKLLVQSPTEAEYKQELKQLRIDFSMYPQILEHVTKIWLKPYKEKFVAAWTDKYMHFGTITWDFNRDPTILQDELLEPFWELPFQGGKRVLMDEEKFDCILEEIGNSTELEHTKIKDSFQNCLAAEEMDDFREIPEFEGLLGGVSIYALKLMLVQWQQACDVINVDCSECSCAIQNTHGLPCCHEIAKYKREGLPIPLKCINRHWKKLDLEPSGNNAEYGVNETMKRSRLSENDASTSTLPPIEVGEAAEDNSLELRGCGPVVQEEVYNIPSSKPFEYIFAVPAILRPYFYGVNPVAHDGNCGFRVIASFYGDSSEGGWVTVRKLLIDELDSNLAHYTKLFGSNQRVDELRHALDYFDTDSTCICKHQMSMPEMGHIIASCFDVVLMYLSSVECFTFLPFRTAPTSAAAEITIAFINEHFVQVLLEPGHPMPSIAKDRERYHEEWATPYIDRIEAFKSLQPVIIGQLNQNESPADYMQLAEAFEDYMQLAEESSHPDEIISQPNQYEFHADSNHSMQDLWDCFF